MRILHLTDRLSERGGADCHLLGVLSDLGRRHHSLLAYGRADGSITAPCDAVQVPALEDGDISRVQNELEVVRDRFAPDVVHAHNLMNPAGLAWVAKRGGMLTIQDHRYFCPGRGKVTCQDQPCAGPMTRERCRACFDDRVYFERILARTRERLAQIIKIPAVIVLSAYMKQELTSVGVLAERISVIPPFVDDLEPEPNPSDRSSAPWRHLAAKPPWILFVGRLTQTKGLDDAIAAWEKCHRPLPLVFAGSGPERGRLENAGHTVLGWVPHREMAAIYRRAAVLLMPSRWQEPFGIVGLEAMSLGLPVVAYQSGGVAEWHPGPFLIPWGDVDALADALAAALAPPTAGPATVSAPNPKPRVPARSWLMQALESRYESLLGE